MGLRLWWLVGHGGHTCAMSGALRYRYSGVWGLGCGVPRRPGGEHPMLLCPCFLWKGLQVRRREGTGQRGSKPHQHSALSNFDRTRRLAQCLSQLLEQNGNSA